MPMGMDPSDASSCGDRTGKISGGPDEEQHDSNAHLYISLPVSTHIEYTTAICTVRVLCVLFHGQNVAYIVGPDMGNREIVSFLVKYRT